MLYGEAALTVACRPSSVGTWLVCKAGPVEARPILPITQLSTIELLDFRLGPIGAVGALRLPTLADGTARAGMRRGHGHALRQTAAFGRKVCRGLA